MSWLPLDQEKQRIIHWRLNGGLGSLIGPPGAGKTATGAAEAVMAAMEGERVLLTAFTNAAANEYCLESCKLVGLEIAQELVIRTGQLEGYQQTTNCPIRFTLDPRKIRKAPIVVTTTLSATNKYLPRDIEFDRVIVDETGIERLEHVLIPLQYCVDSGLRRKVLSEWDPLYTADELSSEITDFVDFLEDQQVTATFIGDPKQSRPISPESRDYSAIAYMARRTKTETLKTTYRLPFNLDVVVDQFADYGGLHAHPSIKDRRLQLCKNPEPPYTKLLEPDPVVTFIDIKGQELSEGISSYSNPTEAKAVVRLAKQIFQCTSGKTSIMAISRYREQRRLIHRFAESEGIPLDTRTTTGALGAQADVVIVSITRNNRMLEVGAFGVLQDLNVAISRACKKLFIVGNWDMLERGWIRLPTASNRGWRGVCWKLARLIDRYGSRMVAPSPLIQ